ncbi:MAG: EAL domain-containing protein [Gammaproteobacteria bacterium]|jgi:diguanylate cyclase (GGDEF)-like protein/PAS domain S-box-containing protein
MHARVNYDSHQQLGLYQRLLESTQAVPWEMDLAIWRFTYVGPQVQQLLGFSADKWLAPNFWLEHTYPEDAQQARQFYLNSVKRGEGHEFEYRMVAADGRVVWIRNIVNVAAGSNGVSKVQGFMFDVTQRRQVELVMQTLAGTGSNLNIEEFYKTCVMNLAKVYDARFAFIGLLKSSKQDVRTRAVWAENQYIGNFEYSLEGTPCKDVLDLTVELIPREASSLYADDAMLVDMGIESYFGAPLIGADGQLIGLVSIMDVKPMELNSWTAPILGVFASRIAAETERHTAMVKLRHSQNALTQAQHIARIGSFEWDYQKGKVYWSEEAVSLLGWQQNYNTFSNLDNYLALVHREDKGAVNGLLHAAMAGQESVTQEHRLQLADGQVRYIEFRAHNLFDPIRQRNIVIGTIFDITERRVQEQALEQMASFDSLTELPNRWSLQCKLEETVDKASRENSRFCLALLDLDGFKEVNDTLGHFAGDHLLRLLKPRLESVLRPGDFVARLGGDEFAFVLDPILLDGDGILLAKQLRQAIMQPFDLDRTQIQIGGSVGLSLYPDHGDEPGDLLRRADVAMYQAKRTMTGYALYDAERDPYGPRRLSLINDIRQAIDNGDLVLYYQPKVETGSRKMCGVEALVRWQHPTHGFIPPEEFIPLCEVSDIIHALTDYVMRQALRDVMQWRQQGHNVQVAVNISARDLMDHALPSRVSAVLEETGASADVLQLEITENDLMHDPDRAKTTVQALCDMGVGLCIDDFGTGYSSLSYLKHLRVQELKIDQSFVCDILEDENDAVIVRSIIDLAHSLGLNVTAEGVESAEILDVLAEYGCKQVQGFHISRPVPGENLLHWIVSITK